MSTITYVSLFGLWTCVLTQDLPCLILESPESLGRSDSMNLWPGGVVPYTLDDNVAAMDRPNMQSVIDDFATRTCIKIRPRQNGDRDWVHIKMNYTMPYACRRAHVCRQGVGAQETCISPNCFRLSVLVHEMGHSLCLHHEHARVDRDQYVDFSGCTDASKIEPINDIPTNRGYLYDYSSQMHYACRSGCPAPKLDSESACGPLRACAIPNLGEVYLGTTHLQVLGTPEGQPVISNDTSPYRLVDPVVRPIADLVAVGRSNFNTKVYAAVLPGKDGGSVAMGWVMKILTSWTANFAVDGKYLQINVTKGQSSAPLNVIACYLD